MYAGTSCTADSRSGTFGHFRGALYLQFPFLHGASMSSFKVSPGRWFGILWRSLDATRRALLNLLFLLIIVLLVVSLFSSGKRIEDRTVLLLDFKGSLVEQQSGSVRQTLTSQLQGEDKENVQLRDVLKVLDAAAKDPKISSTVLLLDEFQGAGMPMLRDVGSALDRFRASGKKVVAWGSGYDQRQYFLAVHADEIYLHPMGVVELEGFGGYRNYYRDALDKLGITVNVMRVGTYKSFAEPFIANAPSLRRWRRRPSCITACGRITPIPSKRRASCRPAASCKSSTTCRNWSAPRTATWPKWRCRPNWWTA